MATIPDEYNQDVFLYSWNAIQWNEFVSNEISGSIVAELTQLHSQSRILARLDERERRAKDAYLNGIDSMDEYKETRMLIQSERDRIQAELDSIVSASSSDSVEDDKRMIQNVRDVIETLKNPDADYTQKGAAIRGIVDKIVFDRKNTSFDFHLKLVK